MEWRCCAVGRWLDIVLPIDFRIPNCQRNGCRQNARVAAVLGGSLFSRRGWTGRTPRKILVVIRAVDVNLSARGLGNPCRALPVMSGMQAVPKVRMNAGLAAALPTGRDFWKLVASGSGDRKASKPTPLEVVQQRTTPRAETLPMDDRCATNADRSIP